MIRRFITPLILLPQFAIASNEALTQLDEIVVSATSHAETVRNTAHGVTVITAQDIENAHAASIGDLLQNQAGIYVRSYFGNDTSTSIDLRGMGANANSNVLILVDGVRQNSNDLSGVNLSTIPLAAIERIEVIRGGGSVRYGDGAVGGVIHIYTHKTYTHKAKLSLRSASYATQEEQLQAATHIKNFAELNAYAGHRQSNGYRANSATRDDDFGVTASSAFNLFERDVQVSAQIQHHNGYGGLPGPLSEQAARDNNARRASNAPHDFSRVNETRYSANAMMDLGDNDQLEFQFTQRERDNPFLIGFNSNRPEANQLGALQSSQYQANLHYERELQLWDLPQHIYTGLNALWGDYQRSENGSELLDTSTKRNGAHNDYAWYAGAVVQPLRGLNLQAGLRQDYFSSQANDSRYVRSGCRTIIEMVDIDIDPGPGVTIVTVPVPREVDCVDGYQTQSENGDHWRNRAYDFGVAWTITPALTSFASISRNFRNPNVDELLLAARDLQPQQGQNIEAGIRATPLSSLAISLSMFRLRIENEIFFGINPTTLRNENFNLDSATVRTGAELETRWQALPALALQWNISYVKPRTKTSNGAEVDIPLAPRLSSHAQIDWQIRPKLNWTTALHYIGARYDGNDFDNMRYPRLPAYFLCDSGVRFEEGKLQVMAGINNLFDKTYSSVAYSNTYYPMPKRNFYLGMKLGF